jgi:hypothetical protein
MWPEMVEIFEIISVCLPLALPPVTGSLEPKLDSRLIGWQTYARLDWQVGGFTADPPTGAIGSADNQAASNAQLVQAMAGAAAPQVKA